MNILIIEDEVLIVRAMKRICQGIPLVNKVDVALNYPDAVKKASSGIYDLFLTDIFLGKQQQNGLDLCEHFRKSFQLVPIIIITSIHSIDFLERAFSLGVNDYLLKPFHPKELQLRIQRWMKGVSYPSIAEVYYKQLRYDPFLHEFSFKEKKLSLTKREKALLLILLLDSEQLIPTHIIEEKFWGDYSSRNHNIRSNIQSLRKSLGDPCSDWIRTVRGEGYVLKKTDD